MQINMHHVEPHITGTTCAQHRIQICPIVVHQTTTVVYKSGNLRDTRLEEAKGIRIRHHHCSNLRALLSNNTLQILKVDRSICPRAHLDDLQSADRRRSRVRPMSTIGHNDLLPIEITSRTVIVINRHQSRQFTMCPRIGLESEMSHTCEFTERALQQTDDGLCTTRSLHRLFRMYVLELRLCGYLLIDFRVILHRTGAERIEACVYTKIIV